MKFIEASKFGGPEVLTIVETPTPLPTEGTLLVEIEAAGVNYADIMARSGLYPRVPKAPFPVGFEIAGVLKGVGKGVQGFKGRWCSRSDGFRRKQKGCWQPHRPRTNPRRRKSSFDWNTPIGIAFHSHALSSNYPL
jgi:NADPH:quinone reductase-like Zn-dependent oxidoreductase